MTRDPAAKLLATASLVLWALLVAVPLAWLYAGAFTAPRASLPGDAAMDWAVVGQSFALAAGIAGLSVLLGFVPGQLLATARRGRTLLAVMLLGALLMPRYLLLYAWALLRSPTTPLGQWIFGLGIALLTILIRLFGGLPEGGWRRGSRGCSGRHRKILPPREVRGETVSGRRP